MLLNGDVLYFKSLILVCLFRSGLPPWRGSRVVARLPMTQGLACYFTSASWLLRWSRDSDVPPSLSTYQSIVFCTPCWWTQFAHCSLIDCKRWKQFFPKQFIVRGSDSFLRCVRTLCHCWCPPFSAGDATFIHTVACTWELGCWCRCCAWELGCVWMRVSEREWEWVWVWLSLWVWVSECVSEWWVRVSVIESECDWEWECEWVGEWGSVSVSESGRVSECECECECVWVRVSVSASVSESEYDCE